MKNWWELKAARNSLFPLQTRQGFYKEHVGLLICLIGAVVSFRGPAISAVQTGLDPSWRLAISEIASGVTTFGSTLAFTYGPIGFLLHPISGFGWEFWSIALSALVHLAVWAFAYEAWRRWGSTLGLIAFSLLFIVARAVGFGFAHWVAYEGELLLLQFLAGVSIALEDRPLLRSVKVAGLAASIAPAGLMKFTLALSGSGVLGVALLVALLQKPRSALPDIALAAGVTGASTAFAGGLAFPSWTDAAIWLRGTVEIAGGYSEAMSVAGSRAELAAAVLSLLTLVMLLSVAWRRGWTVAVAILVAIPVVLLSFKHGFVRHDVHVVVYFPFLIVLIGALSLYEKERLGLLALWLFALAMTGSYYVVQHRWELQKRDWAWQTVTAAPARQALSWVVSPAARRAALDELNQASVEALGKARIPQSWLETIGSQTVTIAPWDLVLCRANGLTCVYPRTVQVYSAYTGYLDEWTAEAFRGPRRPEFVLASFKEIDGRHPWFGAPATWRAIVNGYELVEADIEKNLFLLAKKDEQVETAGEGEKVTLDGEGWYLVDRADGRLVAITMTPTTTGMLRRALFRNDPVQLEVEFGDSSRRKFRFIPSTASAGLMLSNLPVSPEQMRTVILGEAKYPVQRFRIIGPGVSQFQIENVTYVGRPPRADQPRSVE